VVAPPNQRSGNTWDGENRPIKAKLASRVVDNSVYNGRGLPVERPGLDRRLKSRLGWSGGTAANRRHRRNRRGLLPRADAVRHAQPPASTTKWSAKRME